MPGDATPSQGVFLSRDLPSRAQSKPSRASSWPSVSMMQEMASHCDSWGLGSPLLIQKRLPVPECVSV